MAITSFKQSKLIGSQKYTSLLVGNEYYSPFSFESIATATGTGSSGTITFNSIPNTYKHLQLRVNAIASVNGNGLLMQFNSDTTSIYPFHSFYGTGATVGWNGNITTNQIFTSATGAGTSTTIPFALIIDIHDYASTSKNKTVRVFAGIDKNGSGEISMTSGLWMNTSAINSIKYFMTSGNFTTSSTFALYGIKG